MGIITSRSRVCRSKVPGSSVGLGGDVHVGSIILYMIVDEIVCDVKTRGKGTMMGHSQGIRHSQSFVEDLLY